MTDDLEFVRSRLPEYRAYADESDRHDSDMRVRAYVGEALTDVATRLDPSIDPGTRATLDATLLRCMFTDQVFIHTFEHAALEPAMIAALVRSDRALLTLADRSHDIDAAALPALLHEIDERFDERRDPPAVLTPLEAS